MSEIAGRGLSADDLAEALSATASLLYDVWRCNTDAERAEYGERVAAAVERFAVHPSHLTAPARVSSATDGAT